MKEEIKKCCANCSHLNGESECRCPNSVLYKQFIFDVRGEGSDCPQHERDESRKGETMNIAIIINQHDATPDYPFNVQILTNGYYCGNGRFCKTRAEAEEWVINNYGKIEIKEG